MVPPYSGRGSCLLRKDLAGVVRTFLGGVVELPNPIDRAYAENFELVVGSRLVDGFGQIIPEVWNKREAVNLEEWIEMDETIQNILIALEKADVSSKADSYLNGPSMQIYPLWYYRKKLIRSVRRYIPEKYDTTVE